MSEKKLTIERNYELSYVEDVDMLLFDSARSLLTAGDVEKAYGLSHLIKGGYERADLLILVFEFLMRSGNAEDADAVLQEASACCAAADEMWQQAELLCRLATKAATFGMISTARSHLELSLEIARRGERSGSDQDRLDSSSVIGDIVEAYMSLGSREEALETALAIKNEGKRDSVLSRIRY